MSTQLIITKNVSKFLYINNNNNNNYTLKNNFPWKLLKTKRNYVRI